MMTISTPDSVLLKVWNAIPRRVKLLFLFTLVLGLFAHLFMFMHKLPNHDDLNEFTLLAEHNLSLGRWFRNVIFYLSGSFSTPALRGPVGLLFLSAAVCFAVSALGFATIAGAGLAAALMVTTPILSSMFAFMFMAEAFQFSLLCGCASVWLAKKYRRGWLAAAPLLALGMGTYQTCFCIAAALFLFMFVLDLFDKAPLQESYCRLGRYAATLAGAFAVYLAVTMITVAACGVTLAQYQGIAGISGGLFTAIFAHPVRLLHSLYAAFALDVFLDPLGHRTAAVAAAHWALVVIPVVLCVWLFIKRDILAEPGRCISLAVAILLLPAAVSSIYLINAEGQSVFMHVVMTYGCVLSPVFALRLAELAANDGNAGRAAFWCACLAALALSWSGCVYCGETYLKMHLGYEKAMAFSISLISRIQTASGGKRLPLALVGDAGAQIDNSALPSQPFRMMTASFDGPELVECNQYHKFLRDYLGADAVLRLVKGAENDNIAKQPEVEAMPVYPAAGSVKVLFGAVVVKLGEAKPQPQKSRSGR